MTTALAARTAAPGEAPRAFMLSSTCCHCLRSLGVVAFFVCFLAGMRFFPKCPRDREELIDGVIAGGNGGGLVFCEILERAQRAVQAIDLGLMERELRVHGAGDEVDGLDEFGLPLLLACRISCGKRGLGPRQGITAIRIGRNSRRHRLRF